MTQPEPPRGLVGIGVGGLVIEVIVLMLATPAVLAAERGHVTGWHVGYLVGLTVLVVVAAVSLARTGARWPGTVVQLLAVAAGVVTWPMYVVGALFLLVWLYYLRLWRTDARR